MPDLGQGSSRPGTGVAPDPGAGVRARRGAHRPPRPALALLAGVLLAGLALGLGLAVALQGRPQDVTVTAATTGPRSGGPGAPSLSPGPAPRSPSSRAGPTAGSTATPAPTRTAARTTTPAPTRDARRPGVVVLNQTARVGLATRVARRLRERGWRVADVGNFRGTLARTTVYHPPGWRRSARALAADLRGGARVRTRFVNLSPVRLTVVLGSDYPSGG